MDTTDEIWKVITNYPNYSVSNKGKIINYKGQYCYHVLSGYPHVHLNNNGNRKGFFIHRLVASEFIDNPENLPIVDHIDENKHNCCVENLRWVTYKQNTLNSYKNKHKTRFISKYDQHGNYIQTWNSLKDFYNCFPHEKSKNTFRTALYVGRLYNGYYYKFDDNDSFRKKDFHEFQNNQNIDNDTKIINIPIKERNFSQYAINPKNNQVINMTTKQILKPRIDQNGYHIIRLYNKDKSGDVLSMRLHKLIHVVFNKGNYDDLVDHKDGNKTNNHPSNLEAVSFKENVVRAKGKAIVKLDFNGNVLQTYRSSTDAAKELDLNNFSTIRGGIRDNINGRQKSAYGFVWKKS